MELSFPLVENGIRNHDVSSVCSLLLAVCLLGLLRWQSKKLVCTLTHVYTLHCKRFCMSPSVSVLNETWDHTELQFYSTTTWTILASLLCPSVTSHCNIESLAPLPTTCLLSCSTPVSVSQLLPCTPGKQLYQSTVFMCSLVHVFLSASFSTFWTRSRLCLVLRYSCGIITSS